VKRVIGLPGERVEVRNGEVKINGRSLSIHSAGAPGRMDVEDGGSKRWRVSWTEADPHVPDTDIVVPAGQVFLMGDNRNLSEDSRFFGPVPLRDVVGKLRQVWFSVADGHVRWNRMGLVLE
jgi:signal peptidase I